MNRCKLSSLHHPALIPAAIALLGAQLAATSALAQQSGSGVSSLGVVEVTGQSRVQQLQDVPITMQVVGGDKLRSLGAANIASIDAFVPGLQVDAAQPTQPSYTMRGIGSGDFGIGTDAPVGIYVNGVYTGKTGGALMNFNDVKRIEVLKGPQGTLFGRNAAGGAISVVNNEPSQQQEFSGLVRFGNQGARQAEALINQPLSDSLALRFSAVGTHKDGWVRNSVDGKNYGGEHAWGTRLSLRWNGDETTALLSWEHEKLNQRMRPVFLMPSSPSFPVNPSQWVDPRGRTLAMDASPSGESRTFDGLTLRIERPTAWGELTSITAYRHFNSQNIQDNDGTGLRAHYLSSGNIEGNSTWQQEFRLNGKSDKVNWVAGISAYLEHARQNSQVNTYTEALDTVLLNSPAAGLAPYATVTGIAQMLGIPGVNLLGQSWQENMFSRGDYKAFAVYGDAIWKLGEKTNVTTGVRFTRDEKRFSWLNPLRIAAGLDAQLAALDAAAFFPTLVGAGLMTAEQAGALQYLMTNNLEFGNLSTMNTPLKVKTSWNDVSPRLVLDHHLDKNTMLFASATRGYQAGGFNSLNVNGRYEPERVTNYELGAKGTVAGSGLFYNAALFHYDFTNLQNLTLVPATTPTGVPSYQVTVSDQVATGLDIEAQWQIDRVWRLSGSAELINQTYKHYKAPGSGASLAGQPVGTPRVSATLGVDARVPMQGGVGSFGLNWGYVGAQRCNDDSVSQGNCVQGSNFKVGEAMQRVDARLGWEAPGKRWGAALLVNNLLDKQYVRWTSMMGAPFGTPYGWVTPPRSVMLELSAKI